ncbi:hypothetical protein M011DRAFT_165202 [Sporormia fimetaria CBS 119925]|uniref:C3H1-type domain-containing protein n=1 Tax=Sporormia fimetaria CBS 119925 TaxID=1340428 RepID=A0A6A6V2M5_9PLEO|nr:hypothetical protein M011DRAFT_165202 [Sporormia fimetaria CBS 119925]
MASKTPIPIALPEDERFYIVRPDQSMVPLVPIDRTYAVEGVPAKLSHEQLSTEHWKFVAHATKSTAAATSDLQTSSSATSASPPTLQYEPAPVSKPGHYGQPYTPSTEQQVATRSFAAASLSQAGLPRQVDPHQPTPQYATPSIVPRTSPPGAYRAPDHDVRIEQASMNRAQPTLAAAIPPVAAPDRESPSWRTNSTHVDGVRSPPVMSAVTKAYSIAAIRFNPRGIPVDHSKKEYCIHWIRTGECDYMPQGCRFKHEMPTLDYLRRTYNIREIPRWHREHHPLMKKTWLQERVANQGSDRADKARDSHQGFEENFCWGYEPLMARDF